MIQKIQWLQSIRDCQLVHYHQLHQYFLELLLDLDYLAHLVDQWHQVGQLHQKDLAAHLHQKHLLHL